MVELGSGGYIYETTGENWGKLEEDATYKEATAVAVDSDDKVYVFNRGTHPMIVFNTEGEILDTWGHGEFTNPHGRLLMSWGESGTGPGQFNIVHNVIVDNEGLVYIADRENQRVQVFDTDGNFVTQWNDMSRVAAICFGVGDDSNLYLGEYYCGIGSNSMGTNLGPRVSVKYSPGHSSWAKEYYESGEYVNPTEQLKRIMAAPSVGGRPTPLKFLLDKENRQ